MNTTFVRGGAALGAAALALTAFTACSGDDGDDKADNGQGGQEQPVKVSPAAAVEKAAKKTEELTSVTYRMNGTAPGDGEFSGDGAMSFDPVAMQMTMKVDGATAAESGEIEMRLVDEAMYMNAGEEAAKEMDGKSWMKIDLSELDKSGGGDPLSELGGQANQNPADDSQMMTAAEDLKKAGTEKIDGVETTRYTGTVTLDDLRKDLKGEDAETREKREAKLQELEKLGVGELAMEMWIDGEDRTKQFRMQSDTDQGPLDTTMTFLDYNEDVTVETPPAAETFDMSGAMTDGQS